MTERMCKLDSVKIYMALLELFGGFLPTDSNHAAMLVKDLKSVPNISLRNNHEYTPNSFKSNIVVCRFSQSFYIGVIIVQ